MPAREDAVAKFPIREARLTKQLCLKQVGHEIGRTPSYVSKVEKELIDLPEHLKRKLSKCLGTPYRKLCGEPPPRRSDSLGQNVPNGAL